MFPTSLPAKLGPPREPPLSTDYIPAVDRHLGDKGDETLPSQRIPSSSLFPRHFASEGSAFPDGQEASGLEREFEES